MLKKACARSQHMMRYIILDRHLASFCSPNLLANPSRHKQVYNKGSEELHISIGVQHPTRFIIHGLKVAARILFFPTGQLTVIFVHGKSWEMNRINHTCFNHKSLT